MQIIEKRLDELQPYENNPRKNDGAVPYVANSIKEFGFRVPIIIDENNVIIAGHTRYLAAIELELETVPTITIKDLTPEQIKAYRLADNKVGEFSNWDWDLLQEELDELNNLDLDFSMEDLGFFGQNYDIDDFFGDAEEKPDNGMEIENAKTNKIQCPHCGEWFEM